MIFSARILRVGLALLALLTFSGTAAQAHDELISSGPERDAQARQVQNVNLNFSAKILPAGARLVVTGPSGPVVAAISSNGTQLRAQFAESLAPGKYQVNWRAVSKDGHVISGEYRFTALPGGAASGSTASLSAAAGSTARVPQSSVTASVPAVPSTAPQQEPKPSKTSLSGKQEQVLFAIVSLGLIGAMLGLLIQRRRTQGPHT